MWFSNHFLSNFKQNLRFILQQSQFHGANQCDQRAPGVGAGGARFPNHDPPGNDY
jgi:hypothetical protein